MRDLHRQTLVQNQRGKYVAQGTMRTPLSMLLWRTGSCVLLHVEKIGCMFVCVQESISDTSPEDPCHDPNQVGDSSVLIVVNSLL